MLAILLGLASFAAASGGALPAAVVRQLPPGYAVLTSATVMAGAPGQRFTIVALERRHAGPSSRRPLLIFERRADGRYALNARNDRVVMSAEEGGQCDPFGAGAITAKGRSFIVTNQVACGAHWIEQVRFRFEPRLHGFVFDALSGQSWSLNPSSDPKAEALVSDGTTRVRGNPVRPVRFSRWRRPE